MVEQQRHQADVAVIDDPGTRTLVRNDPDSILDAYRTFSNFLACGVVMQDATGAIAHANDAAQQIFERRNGCMAGLTPPDADVAESVVRDDGSELPVSDYPPLAALRTRQPQRHVTIGIRREDGIQRWLQIDSVPLLGADGEALLVVSSVLDVTAHRQTMEVLQHQALHDALTSLPNRTLLYDRLSQAIAAARRTGEALSLLLLDLDRFKDVNDTLGHHYGDLLLKQVGPRLRTALRQNDTIARLGGDEFAILLPGTEHLGATETARKVLTAMDEPFFINGHRFDVGASIGIALHPAHSSDPDTLLRHADVAMYVAKRANCGYAVYAVEQDRLVTSRLALTGDLRQALTFDQLLVFYQPKVNFHGQPVTSVEALVRWQHPSHGLMMPGQFVRLADQTQSTKPLSLWVLDVGLRQCKAWQQQGLVVGLAVNLSTRNLHDPQIAAMIAESLRHAQVAPEWLKVEVSEDAVMADPARARDALTRLSAMSIRIALDDFGTGCAPTAFLKRLPLDEIKIDRSYITTMMTSEPSKKIVRSTIALGHALGVKIVAVGVESRETWEELARMGCDAAQGYYLCRPQPADKIERWLREQGL